MSEINIGWKEIREPHTGDVCFKLAHPTGLTIFVCPKKGYASSYAVFGTRYGSIDTVFYKDRDHEPTHVPAGIAHYLEHKLFENEDAGAFERYAKTGASANAYTGFDRTAYLFTCTDRLEESLEILLDFVQSPYFTEETVAKEQGIIGQEIRMGEDSPSRQVLFNLLRALYHKHPVRIDIAGTVESIAKITPELLYGCYNTFYNLNNMVLAVVGNATPELVKKVADRILKQGEDKMVERAGVDEPPEVVQPRTVQKMPVSAPLFYLGFKDYFPDGKNSRTPEEIIAAGVLLEILAGRSSGLYNRLMERGLINSSFDSDYFDGPGYGIWLFGGESSDPDAVARAISDEIERLRKDGIPAADFEAAHKAMYGRQVSALNDIENVGDILISDFFAGRSPFSAIDAAAGLKLETVERLLNTCLLEHQMALSIVSPV
ncbi:MAG: pitrilysin family protein [Oscillospiraceae bacterium]|nr:pitrilysin family protein [Oscillospiraceae bacterium]MDD4412998.1 pitrilysin family protein [Oscillospiraceae bacterium]